MKKLLTIVALAIGVASCNSKYEKTESGLSYKIFEGDGKEKFKPGQSIKINGIVKIAGRDTVLFTSYGKMPEYIPFDTATRKSHDFNEVLKLCSVGDSLITVAQVDTLVKLGLAQYNEVLKRGDEIVTTLKFIKTFANEQEKVADQQKEFETLKQREITGVESYLKKKGIKAQKTANGVFVEVKEAGAGPKAAAGNQVTVDYKGSLMEGGKVFDSNTDTIHGHVQPFSFVIGSGQTIRAWEEGFQYFGKGGKGTLYVPSMMAYGPQGSPPVIPPYAPLVFEVTVKDIGAAPQQPQMQMPPQQGNPQQQQPGKGN